MNDDYLIGYAVNVLERSVRLYSNTGGVKEVVCETPQQFLNIVEYMDKTLKKEDWVDVVE